MRCLHFWQFASVLLAAFAFLSIKPLKVIQKSYKRFFAMACQKTETTATKQVLTCESETKRKLTKIVVLKFRLTWCRTWLARLAWKTKPALSVLGAMS